MNIEVNKYTLPDIDILNNISESRKIFFWIPDACYVVLGISNNAEDSVIEENVIKDKVKVFKRPSGGEAVVLTPLTLVISSVDNYTDLKSPKEFFILNNLKIIAGLESLGVKNLYQKGISDISINNKKILGSSIYRTKDKIFYQAVLNINEEPDLFEKYLKHPKKEPDYRKGRRHNDFVTSLHAEGYSINSSDIIKALELFY